MRIMVPLVEDHVPGGLASAFEPRRSRPRPGEQATVIIHLGAAFGRGEPIGYAFWRNGRLVAIACAVDDLPAGLRLGTFGPIIGFGETFY